MHGVILHALIDLPYRRDNIFIHYVRHHAGIDDSMCKSNSRTSAQAVIRETRVCGVIKQTSIHALRGIGRHRITLPSLTNKDF